MPHHDPEDARPASARRAPPAWLALLGWLALAAITAAIGGYASRDAGDFYGALARPAWAPPSWLFGPVWTTLYAMMGVAAWLVWRERPTTPDGQRVRRTALTIFVAHLALNALWSWLFFAWRNGAGAFGEVVLLWIAVAVAAWYFHRVRPLAAYLLVPYLAWVTFATALTWAVWQRNPGLL